MSAPPAATAPPPSVVFVTGNANKLREVKAILADVIPDLQSISIDGLTHTHTHIRTTSHTASRQPSQRILIVLLTTSACLLAGSVPELQGADALTITRAKAIYARQHSPYPVLVEDTSLCFNALHSLPGPYIKWHVKQHTIQRTNTHG